MKRIIFPIVAILISHFSFAQVCTKAQLPASLQNGLVAFYPFCGNANDVSGNGNNGTVNGATLTTDRFGNNNSAYFFSSVNCNTYIQANVNTSSIQNGLTISLWATRSGNGCIAPRLFEFWPGSNGPGMAQWDWSSPDSILIGSVTSSGFESVTRVPAPPVSVWAHLLYTNDGSIAKFYVNGQLVKSLASTGSPTLASDLAIGRMNHPSWDAFNGKIDDFIVYNRALTECEVQQLFSETSGSIFASSSFNYNFLPVQKRFCGTSTSLDAGSGYTSYLWNTGATSQTISATAAGKYSVTVTNASGCSASDTINVSLVKADILQNDQTVCLNTPLTLSINSYANQSTKTIDFDNVGLAALDVSSGTAGSVSGVSGNGLSISRPTEVRTKDQTYGYGDYEVDAKTGTNTSNQYLSILLPLNSWTNEAISIDSRPSGTDDVGWGVYVNAVRVAFANGSHPASASNWYKMKIRVTPDSVKCWINNTLLYQGLNTTVPRNIGAIKLSTFSTSHFDNLKFTPYQTYTSVLWSTSATTSTISVTPTATSTYYATITDGISSCTDSVKITVNSIIGFGPLQDTVKVCGDSIVLDAGAGFATYNWSNGATTRTITAKTSGKYFVTVANASGCNASDTSIVSIVKAKILQRDTTICKGSSIRLAIDSSFSNRAVCNSLQLTSRLQNGLVGYFPFCGNANDASGNGNNGVVAGATLTTDRFGNLNSAYNFSGSNQYISVSASNLPRTARTTSLWFKTSNPSYRGVLFGYGGDGNCGTSYFAGTNHRGTGKLMITGHCMNNETSVTYSPPANEWVHLVTTSSSSNGTNVYINGKLVATSNRQFNTIGSKLFIGANVAFDGSSLLQSPYTDNNISGDFWLGGIDDVMIYNRELTNAEVLELHTKQNSVTWSTGSNTNSVSVTPATTTKYFVTVSDGITTCKDSITVTVSDIGSFNPLQDTVRVCGDSLVLDAGAGFATYNWSNGATTRTITAKSSGKYFVNVANASGCNTSDTSIVSIVKAKILQRDTTICKGSSITLSIDSSFNSSRSSNALRILSPSVTEGLIAYYPFNNNANDESGNNRNGVVNNAVLSTDRFGNLNNAYQFNGSNSWIEANIPNLPVGNSPRTICFWANQTQLSRSSNGAGSVFHYGTITSNNRFCSLYWPDIPTFIGEQNDACYTCIGSNKGTNIGNIMNDWHFVVYTYDGSTVKCFVDNVLYFSASKGLNTALTSLVFGRSVPSHQGGEYFIGKIDDVMVYNRALSLSDLSQIYNFNPTVSWSTGAATNSIRVTPATTTKYFVTVSDGITTCKDSITVTVSDIGSFNPLQDTVKVCGDSLLLDAGAGFATYNWSNGATTRMITAKASGKYSVNVANTSGCSASDSSIVSIVKSKILQRDTTICKGSSLTLAIDSSFSGRSVCNKSDLPINLQNGLVAYYPFCGNANDVSGNLNNGTVYNAKLTTDRFGISNSAYDFDGTSSYIDITKQFFNNGLNQYSISLWAYPTSNMPNDGVGQTLLNTNPHRGLSVSYSYRGDKKLTFWNQINPNSGGNWDIVQNPLNHAVTLNTWINIVIVKNGLLFSIYVNGVLDKSINISANPILQMVGMQIGSISCCTKEYFKGKIDDVGFWNRSLSLNEIQELYSSTSTIRSFTWSTGATTPSIVVNPTVKTTYKVTVTDGITTCTDSVIVDVSSSELKVTDPAAVCSPGVVNLTAGAVTAGSASGLTYTYWKDSTATQALVNPDKVSVSGTYYIVGTSATGCTSAPTAVRVTINPLPVATIVTPTQTTICDKSTLSLTATGGTSYQWFYNGAVIAGATSSTYAASQAGSYEVNVMALGCTSRVAAPVNLSLITAALPKFSNSSTCIDVPVSFFNETDTSTSGSINWLWDFGDGQTSTIFNPVNTYKKSGAFIVKLTVTPKLCSSLPSSITKSITVDVPPVGIRYPNVLAVKNKATPLSARFIANGYSYLWMPSSGLNNGAIQNPVFNASIEQLYRVRLTSPGGCVTMDTVKVSVYDSSDIFVPKAFSPNKDGKNDMLQPFLVNITTLKYFRIYNRWGQLMFQTSDSRQGWDGMYNYKPQPLETYTWIAEGIDGNGTTIFRKGQTVLIR